MAISRLEPETYEENLAVYIYGEDLHEYRKEAAVRSQLRNEARQYLSKPPCCWPAIKFNWDLSKASQCFSLDGVRPENFHVSYPNGFSLGWVRLRDFDAHLCKFNKREGMDELWNVGCKSKLSYLIAYLSHGHPISPPLVKPLGELELMFQGGNHRYAIAKATEQETLPIYVEPKHQLHVGQNLDVTWAN